MADENNIDDEIASELSYLHTAIDETPHPDEPAPDAPYIDMEQPAPDAPYFDMEQAAPPVSEGGGVGVRASYGGFGPDQGQSQVWAKGYEDFAENDRRLRGNTLASASEFDSAYSSQADAINKKATVEAEYHGQLQEIHNDRMEYLRESAELDKVMYAQARAESHQYLESYQKQLAAVRQMSVQAPMSKLSGGEFAGVSLAAFAQGFLSAQGIHINPIAQINRWEEMSIQQQERQIQQAEKGAQDQFNLWQIAKETSKDDLEARQRYRGMVLEQFGAAIDMQAARFNSQMANAAAATAKAQLEMERANVMNSLRTNYEGQRLANLKGMRDEMHKRVEERRLNWQTAIEAKYKKALADAATAKTKPEKAANLLIDSRNVMRDKDGKPVSGGKVVGELSHDAPAETQKAVISKKQLNDAVQTGMEQLRQLYTELETKAGPGWIRRRMDDNYALFDAERNRIIGDIMRNFTGLAATDKEAERWLNQLKDDAYLQAGPDRLPRLMDGMSKWARQGFESSLDLPGVIKYAPDQQGYSQQLNIDPEGSALDRARGSAHLPGQVEQLAGAVIEKNDYANQAPSSFYKANRQKPNVEIPDSGLVNSGVIGGALDAMNAGKPEKWATQLEDVAKAAIDPKKYLTSKAVKDVARAFNIPESLADKLADKNLDEDPEAARETAKFILTNAAYGNPLKEGQPALPEVRKQYARKLLEAYEKDPQALLKELGE